MKCLPEVELASHLHLLHAVDKLRYCLRPEVRFYAHAVDFSTVQAKRLTFANVKAGSFTKALMDSDAVSIHLPGASFSASGGNRSSGPYCSGFCFGLIFRISLSLSSSESPSWVVSASWLTSGMSASSLGTSTKH